MKKRRTILFYGMLPLFVIPFISGFFWLMGGGSPSGKANAATGLNFKLPSARVEKDSMRNKLSFYEQAGMDSLKREEALRNDPNILKSPEPVSEMIFEDYTPAKEKYSPRKTSVPVDETVEEAIYHPVNHSKNVLVPDPELEAINQTIEKLAALQRPGISVEKKSVVKESVFSVSGKPMLDESYFGKRMVLPSNGFLSDQPENESVQHSFGARVPFRQVLQSGSAIQLLLNKPLYIAGIIIPSGHLLHGIASIQHERLQVLIPSIRIDKKILPVSLSVYDLDGIEGIYIPGSAPREILRSAADQSIQSVNLLSLDPSIKTQAAMAGIGAAKNLLSRKVKNLQVTVEAGYQVLLRDTKEQ